MLDYEWGPDPSPIILSGEEPEPDSESTFASDPVHHVSHHHLPTYGTLLAPPPPACTAAFSHQFGPQYGGGFYEQHPQSYPVPPYHPAGGGGGEFLVVAKREEGVPAAELAARIGLNLGGRTYFSTEEEEFVNRLYRRSRTGLGEPGSGSWARCQAEGCNADLSQAKHYHRRHKVCEFHSKASTVITAGLTQRFCQQCSRFHVLAEFDNGKRSCRKRLADHNRRRRKTTQQSNQGSPKSQPFETTSSSTDAAAGSMMDSTNQSSWTVTVAVSPPQMSLDCLNQRSY